ncbi:hypothetical protein [Prosthecobacter sp.]|uniref:hypothetical protein n=1 Tax=Prosthecobacter sp. TaxID=1965333 RepID=UPI0024891EAD|nr:hypothetical protein [Prosthecobacter sp.]MDI1314518.1 hypothetical protein [Prosthecobacter sp.]
MSSIAQELDATLESLEPSEAAVLASMVQQAIQQVQAAPSMKRHGWHAPLESEAKRIDLWEAALFTQKCEEVMHQAFDDALVKAFDEVGWNHRKDSGIDVQLLSGTAWEKMLASLITKQPDKLSESTHLTPPSDLNLEAWNKRLTSRSEQLSTGRQGATLQEVMDDLRGYE